MAPEPGKWDVIPMNVQQIFLVIRDQSGVIPVYDKDSPSKGKD